MSGIIGNIEAAMVRSRSYESINTKVRSANISWICKNVKREFRSPCLSFLVEIKKNTLRFEIESVLENAAAYILHEILIVHHKLGLFFYVDITFTVP